MWDLAERIKHYEAEIAVLEAGIDGIKRGAWGHYAIRDGVKVDTSAEVIATSESAIAELRKLIQLWAEQRT